MDNLESEIIEINIPGKSFYPRTKDELISSLIEKANYLNDCGNHTIAELIENGIEWIKNVDIKLDKLDDDHIYKYGYVHDSHYSVQEWQRTFDNIFTLVRNVYANDENDFNDSKTKIVK